jgi:hypothetical protein
VVAKVVVEAATRKAVTALHRGFCGPSGDIAAAVRAVDEAGELVGHPLVEVQTRLAERGLRVQPRTIAIGQVPAGQVIAVDPVGPVAPGGSVTVTYAVAPAVQADEEDGDAKGNGNGRGEWARRRRGRLTDGPAPAPALMFGGLDDVVQAAFPWCHDRGQTAAFTLVRSGSLTTGSAPELRKRTILDIRGPLPVALGNGATFAEALSEAGRDVPERMARDPQTVVELLMWNRALHDEKFRAGSAQHYRALDAGAAPVYEELMTMLGREPRPPFTAETIGAVCTAVAEGLALRASLNPGFYPDRTFGWIILALIPLLTRVPGGDDDAAAWVNSFGLEMDQEPTHAKVQRHAAGVCDSGR